MANSWRLVAIGSYNSGTWQGEIAQIGISGACSDAGAITSGQINANLPTFDAVAAGTSGSSTHMTFSFGANGVGAYNEANQKTVCEAMWTFLGTIVNVQPTSFTWKEIRLSAIATDGHVVNGATVGTITSPVAGLGTMNQPPQASLVQSFVTGGRGPRNRGRMYVPASSMTLGTDGKAPSTWPASVNPAARTMILAINAVTGWQACVVSRTHSTFSSITATRTGDEVDSQQRRRRHRRETYTQLAI